METANYETNPPIRKMATNEIPNFVADGPPSAPDMAPPTDAANKSNGNRGKRGGRDRGNDKQKRKHSGFGSAKYVAASAIPWWLLNADTDELIEATFPTSASRFGTTAMRNAAR